MLRHDGYVIRRASLSSLSVISCDSGRASLRTVGEDRPEICFIVCYTFFRTAYWVIHKYFPTRSDGAIREYYRPHVSYTFLPRALGIDVRAIVYNPSNESEN